MYIHRQLENLVISANGSFKALLITGPRQVGKTTMLQHLAVEESRTYVTMDDLNARALAKSDPSLFFQTYKPPILIDEVQYAPELFPYVKMLCDNSDKNGIIWMTGSQQYSMMKSVTESLAGRIAILNLYGFTTNELRGIPFKTPLSFDVEALAERNKIAEKTDMRKIYGRIWQGGQPEAIAKDGDLRGLYFESYVNTYLMRDVTDLGGVSDSVKFRRFLTACAALSGQLLNYATLAEATDISEPTAKSWVNLLVGLNIIFLLQPYHSNKLKTLVKTPKLYFWDTGLCAYLASWLSVDALMNGAASGAYFENYVISELIKSYKYCGSNSQVYFFRDKKVVEVDLVITDGQSIHLAEIKRTASPTVDMVKSFSAVKPQEPYVIGTGAVICNADSFSAINRDVLIIPAYLI